MTAQNNTPKPKKPLVSPHFLGYFILMMIGAITLGALQYHYWYGDLGYYELAKLKAEVAKQQKANAEQERLNTVLTADIADLKSGFGAIETRSLKSWFYQARRDLCTIIHRKSDLSG